MSSLSAFLRSLRRSGLAQAVGCYIITPGKILNFSVSASARSLGRTGDHALPFLLPSSYHYKRLDSRYSQAF